MPKIVGIDLGTTNSLVAIVENDVPKIIPTSEGHRMVPSMIHFGEDGSVQVGHPAREMMLDDSGRTIFSIKRFMGKGIDDVQGRSVSPALPGLIRKRKHHPDRCHGPGIHAARVVGLRSPGAEAAGRGGSGRRNNQRSDYRTRLFQ